MRDSWKKKRIEAICEILDSKRIPLNAEQRSKIPGNIPYYGANGVQGYISEYIFDEDLILMAEDGGNFEQFSTRPIAYQIEGKSWVNNHAHILKAKDEYSQDYIFYTIVHKNILPFIKGGTRSKLNLSDLKSIEIILPPLPQQQKIAQILSTCDTVLEKTEEAIAKYKAIKQGLLHDLFTRGIDPATGKLRPSYEEAPEMYKETELGFVPKEWEVAELGSQMIKIGSGKTPTGGSEVYQKSGVLFIRSQNVLFGELKLEDAAFISPKVDNEMSNSRVYYLDVLLNITGASIGRCAYYMNQSKTANVNQHVCILRFEKENKTNTIFAVEFLNSPFGQDQIRTLNAGGNREGLNFQQIASFDYPVIPISELQKITEITESLNTKIQTEILTLSKYQTVKAGLMQDLLSGAVGVEGLLRKRKIQRYEVLAYADISQR